MSVGLNYRSNIFKIQRSQILGWKKVASSHQFISIVNGSSVIPYIFNVVFLKEEILLHLWRYPSLSIHGIEGAFHEPGIKTVIPAKVIGKFSIRQVPHMDLSVVKQQVRKRQAFSLASTV